MHARHAERASMPATTIIRTAAAVAAVAAAFVLLAAVGAGANPSLQDKRAQAEAILAEIQRLDEEVGDAAERWNGANLELASLTDELAETRADLRRSRVLYRASQERIATRLRELYVNGTPGGAVEVVLGARSLGELLDLLDATSRVAQQDRQIARDAKAFRGRVTKREKELVVAREEQAVIVARLAAEKQAIEGALAERERLLGSVREEIARMEAEERRRQEELRRRALAELEARRRAAAAAAQARAEARAAVRVEAEASASAPLEASAGQETEPEPVSEPAPVEEPLPLPPAPPADASRGAQVVAIAMRYLGVPYVWGGMSPSGFDCSGLTSYVFAQIGVSLPHHAATQYGYGVPVGKEELQPGDLVFFRGLGHMGMYVGGGSFIHAPHTGDVVKITSLYSDYYVRNWVGARRVL
jgi:cell wall-associated NlpC family hydrolase